METLSIWDGCFWDAFEILKFILKKVFLKWRKKFKNPKHYHWVTSVYTAWTKTEIYPSSPSDTTFYSSSFILKVLNSKDPPNVGFLSPSSNPAWLEVASQLHVYHVISRLSYSKPDSKSVLSKYLAWTFPFVKQLFF